MKRIPLLIVLEDDIPQEVKEARVEEIMELQSQYFGGKKNQGKNR